MSNGTVRFVLDRHVPDLGALPSRRAQVVDTLRTAIVAGEFDTGTVYSAPALAAQLGVSPTPVREAMMHLANDGLIEIVRNKGFRIVEPSDADLDEMLELRFLLEVPTIVKVAKGGISDAQAARLHALAEVTVASADAQDFSGHVAADIAFHVAVLELGGNVQLVALVRGLRSRARLFGLTSPSKAQHLRSTSREHGELVHRIAAGDARGAQRLMRDHISHIRREWARP
jgi:DNA-binding GntR family transcriptional regulator